jgi:hypothetical protein
MTKRNIYNSPERRKLKKSCRSVGFRTCFRSSFDRNDRKWIRWSFGLINMPVDFYSDIYRISHSSMQNYNIIFLDFFNQIKAYNERKQLANIFSWIHILLENKREVLYNWKWRDLSCEIIEICILLYKLHY